MTIDYLRLHFIFGKSPNLSLGILVKKVNNQDWKLSFQVNLYIVQISELKLTMNRQLQEKRSQNALPYVSLVGISILSGEVTTLEKQFLV